MMTLAFLRRVAAVFVAVTFIGASYAQDESRGTVVGTVSSAGGNMLEGAVIEIPSLNRRTLTRPDGSFRISGLPIGEVTLRATYTGTDEQSSSLTVVPGQPVSVDFTLGEETLLMSTFVVQAVREGQALAITNQKNSGNVKNVMAMDAMGILPNLSAGELASRMPGVAGNHDDDGNVIGLAIRGSLPQLSRLTVDGGLLANSLGLDRQFQFQSMTGAMFEELEVIKGQTPDRSADAIGGGVNLKTRSPLKLKGRSRTNYNIGARWTAPFLKDYPSMGRGNAIKPIINLSHQQVFDVMGGERNLGIAVNAFYSVIANAPTKTTMDYEYTTDSPAYVWDYREGARISLREQMSFSLKAEFKVSDTSKIWANLIYNDSNEPENVTYESRAFSNRSVAGVNSSGNFTGNGSIIPGYTDSQTSVRPVSSATMKLTTLRQSVLSKTRGIDIGGDHQFDRWDLSYRAGYSRAFADLGHGKDGQGGNMDARVSNIGWDLEYSDPNRANFTQTAGADIYDINSYNKILRNTQRDSDRDSEVSNAMVDLTYRLLEDNRLTLKTGASYREQIGSETNRDRRYSYVGNAPLPVDSNTVTAVGERTGLNLPFVDLKAINAQLGDPTLWAEDVYYRESRKYSNTREATEEVNAGYVMLDSRINRLGIVAGVRLEKTDVTGEGYIRVDPATSGEIPDPAERAEHDWNHLVTNKGSYTSSFPSVHFVYDLTRNLKARASWSTSFGRPSFKSLVPSAGINNNNQTVKINNASLEPQYAENIDLALEYYINPAGIFSVTFFKKDIEDFIRTIDVGVVPSGDDNGFDGSYDGYTILSDTNAGLAEIEGWEFNYSQQLTKLPGLLQGFGVTANYTHLKANGDFGGNNTVTGDNVAGFIPQTGNAGLTFKYKKFGARVLYSFTGDHLFSDSTQENRRIYKDVRETVNLGVNYEFKPSLKIYINLTNLTDEPGRRYRYIASRMQNTVYAGPSITCGFTGRF